MQLIQCALFNLNFSLAFLACRTGERSFEQLNLVDKDECLAAVVDLGPALDLLEPVWHVSN